MKANNIFFGIWFQRTHLHLIEIYDFLKYRNCNPELDQKKATKLLDNIDDFKITLHEENDFDYLSIEFEDVFVEITEDGIMSFSVKKADISTSFELLTNFYLNKFAPVIKFVFGMGAPLPKTLKNLDEIYPFFIITKNSTDKEIINFFDEKEDRILSTIVKPKLDIYNGDKFEVINLKDVTLFKEKYFRDYLDILIFNREFEIQLKNYLNTHRRVWQDIAKIRQSKSIKYKDFPEIRTKILDHTELLTFGKSRLNQMKNNIESRQLYSDTHTLELLKETSQLRFNYLLSNQEYISELWEMTVDYANSTLQFFDFLFEENTQNELNAIKFVTILSFFTGFFGMNIAFPWEERWEIAYISSFFIAVLIAIFGVMIFKLIRGNVYDRRVTVHVKEKEIAQK